MEELLVICTSQHSELFKINSNSQLVRIHVSEKVELCVHLLKQVSWSHFFCLKLRYMLDLETYRIDQL